MIELFVGIDVAVARSKRLPIAVLRRDRSGTSVVALKDLAAGPAPLLPPRGRGNVAIVVDAPWPASFAAEAMRYLDAVAARLGGSVRRIAIDAPARPRRDGVTTRPSEAAMTAAGLSFFKTPCLAEFESIRAAAKRHLARGGSAAELPYANQLWMLAGFELFTAAARHFRDVDVLEVYPEATFRAMGAAEVHKSSSVGLASRSVALAGVLGVTERGLARALPRVGWGSAHDKIDALSAAWVASLPRSARAPFGDDPDDQIWSVPRQARGVAR